MAKKTLGEMVWGFATELATHAKGGFAHVDPVTYSRRISTCMDCPLFAAATLAIPFAKNSP